jgi:hypothetical protein
VTCYAFAKLFEMQLESVRARTLYSLDFDYFNFNIGGLKLEAKLLL